MKKIRKAVIAGLLLLSCLVCTREQDIPTARLKQTAREFAESFWHGELDTAATMLAPVLQEQLPHEKLLSTREMLIGQYGAFVEFSEDSRVDDPKGDFYPVVLRCRMKKGELNLQITLDPHMQVAGIFYDDGGHETGSDGNTPMPDSVFVKAALQFGNRFWRGEIDSAYTSLAQVMKDNVSVGDFKSLRHSVLDQQGAFKMIREDVRVSLKGAYHVVVLKCEFARGVLNMQLSLDRHLKVAGLYFV